MLGSLLPVFGAILLFKRMDVGRLKGLILQKDLHWLLVLPATQKRIMSAVGSLVKSTIRVLNLRVQVGWRLHE